MCVLEVRQALHFHDFQGHHIFPERGDLFFLLLLFLVQKLNIVDC